VSAVDPGRNTRTVEPHPGDTHAQQIRAALRRLDGTTASAVSLLTGMDGAELDELGGFKEENRCPSKS
jgi:hypothetical protein